MTRPRRRQLGTPAPSPAASLSSVSHLTCCTPEKGLCWECRTYWQRCFQASWCYNRAEKCGLSIAVFSSNGQGCRQFLLGCSLRGLLLFLLNINLHLGVCLSAQRQVVECASFLDLLPVIMWRFTCIWSWAGDGDSWHYPLSCILRDDGLQSHVN